MILTFRKGRTMDSLMQTELVDGNGNVAFDFAGGRKRTTVARWTYPYTGIRSRMAVATIDWHDTRPIVVTYRGMVRDADDYLFKQGGPSMRAFTSATGRSYVWSPIGKSWQLHVLGICQPVARSHNRSFGILGAHPHPSYLELDDAVAAADAEEIVLTYIYMKHHMQPVLETCFGAIYTSHEAVCECRRKLSY
ncbi:hypothetical protein K488DRAFT_72851 [Vararia minispora EC-137]|uniref:Uncharacterized protein n=1 Tax=Vararia minispora EC-137 TaxID=1314806 RepID=A0ACB8QD93_9AGAM|nr:hypothetical protein K488DRAFT_72851 [Vararia minispora EC-137]